MIDREVNFSEPPEWAVLFDDLRQLKGVHSVEIHKKRRDPSQNQHGYYRGCVLPILRRWLNETQGGMPDGNGGFRDYTDQEAHGWAKEQGGFGSVTHDPRTGEQTGFIVKSCADMSSTEMYELTDWVVGHLQSFQWNVPAPDRDWRINRARAMKEKETAHA